MKSLAILLALLWGFQDTETQEKKYSGPQKGEKLPGFVVLDATGPHKDEKVDYIAEFKGGATLLVFVHEVTRPGARLVRQVDRIVQDRKDFGLNGLVVLLGDDMFDRERYAPRYQTSLGMKTVIGVSVDGLEGPGAYGLNKEMELTIIVAKDNKVTANFALLDPNETVAKEIEKAVDAILPVPEMSAKEMAKEMRRLQIEVRRLRRELEEMRRQNQNRRRRQPRRMEREDDDG